MRISRLSDGPRASTDNFVAHLRALPRSAAFTLIACALLLRALIPAGWMPTTGADGVARISICTGMGPTSAWIDRDGKLHKEAPAKKHRDQQPCGFGALGAGLDATPSLAIVTPADPDGTFALIDRQTLSISHGLAAPPPPSTGPPHLT